MYKVLIVDDERIIREGIANVINWEENGLTLLGTAIDGIDAYKKIKSNVPDIVIIDIIMPGMNGIDLITKVSQEYKDISFIILSGHGEFNYASRAMELGVKHYILKPCDENTIIPVLEKVKKEKNEKENFLKNINYNLKKVIPQVKEQFLREFVMGGRYSSHEINYFRDLFKIGEDKFKLIILKIDKKSDLLEKFALKNIACELIMEERVYLSSIVEDNIVMIIKSIDLDELSNTFIQIKKMFFKYFKVLTSIVVSNENSFNNIQEMYKEVQECLKYEFYLGEGSIITNTDIKFEEIDKDSEIKIDYDAIAIAIKTGDIESISLKLKNIFQVIDKRKLEIEIAKTYCIELFLVIIRQQTIDKIREYSKDISKIDNMSTLSQIYQHIEDTAYKIAEKNYESTNKNYGMVINEVVKCIEDNISNESLSLTWIAKEVLFMNENYLGKLFHKQTNEKFSQYVIRVRMEKAKELIVNNDYKIYEITERVGFADNTQYFSQVFKKYTGYTPSEYKKL